MTLFIAEYMRYLDRLAHFERNVISKPRMQVKRLIFFVLYRDC